MGNITKSDIQKLALLSRLRLDDDEQDRYLREIESILHYVDALQNIDTEGLKPTYQVNDLSNVTRPDELVDYGTTPESLMQNAPSVSQGMFKVKRMVG